MIAKIGKPESFVEGRVELFYKSILGTVDSPSRIEIRIRIYDTFPVDVLHVVHLGLRAVTQ